MGWLGFGLPGEGQEKSKLLLKHIERQFPKCGITDSIETARRRANQMGFDICPVLNEADVLLGLITKDPWQSDTGRLATEVMDQGPKTLRPNATVDEARKLLDEHQWSAILVTSSNGKLLGIFTSAPQAIKPRI